ncbi:putative microneme protein MIC6 [Neospora caninum Liverpool]|uniref:Microneme protein MIC6, putative n=2 Tax=Neospora caninum TaxID=29176 RepID=F0VPV4_NEOCL|nr:putative microneme protein MIC6 [Neospora caninum Liverpool]ALB39003.1 microneme protein 6 [Neospora caninum]CBZ55751.1 putative microneme protein MIC6 [Neospora caninum Liverpool]CEL70494.1 TPA: microneme protein MIC6, putative [Neospora caninum Liverpool]|eukprot:XP_003885777.1 putative microneme protein MIC6 [Neospora caninum Liverpool]
MWLFRNCVAAVVAAEGFLWLQNDPRFFVLPGNGQVANPCDGKPCGPDEAGSCVSTPSGYTCECEQGYDLGVENDQVTCVVSLVNGLASVLSSSKTTACRSNPCGPTEAGVCEDATSGYICHCKPGYTPVNGRGGLTCKQSRTLEWSLCENNACGPANAVQECRPVGYSGRVCLCNEGFEAVMDATADIKCKPASPHRHRPDTGPGRDRGITPTPGESGEGEEDGSREDEPVPERDNTDRTPPANDGTQPEEKSGGKKEESKGSAAAIAGGVIGGLLLLGAAGGGAAYMMKSKGNDESEQVNFETGEAGADNTDDVEVLVDMDSKTWD